MNLRTLLAVVLITAAALGMAAYQTIKWAQEPAVSPRLRPPSKTVTIPDRSSFQQVAALLEREELIRSRLAFVWLGRFQAADRKIQAGEYELNASMTPAEILSRLTTGVVVLHPVLIPEGLTMVQIAEIFVQQGLMDRQEALRWMTDPGFIASLGIRAPTLEGYLYPDTYKFPKGVRPKEVLTTMVEHLRQVYGPELQARAKELNMTQHEVLTLASIIEKESGSNGEREEISAVFHNRLKKRIPLQSDPTVIYGLPNYDGNIHKKDLSSPSPYNTYRISGLPPGPIANPGIQSIRAALYPSNSRALYFVSRNDGTHQFSATLAEHNEAVERYQKRPFRRGMQPRTSPISSMKRAAP
ncbi:MAG TPA: endolytic transglycosylase MltG [Nitrospira sp.]|nr:endolytic transglycosylase MltG [Nitrospira sp.]